MSFSIIITDSANRDIQKAIDWENNRSQGLGFRFYKFLQQKFTLLSNTPAIGSIRYENVRCTAIDVFSYLIHYTIDLQMQKDNAGSII